MTEKMTNDAHMVNVLIKYMTDSGAFSGIDCITCEHVALSHNSDECGSCDHTSNYEQHHAITLAQRRRD